MALAHPLPARTGTSAEAIYPIAGMPVLTAAQMREAEAAAVTRGISLAEQMRRAGEGVAAVVQRLAAGAPALVLCGPGNNGGDGWIAAAALARAGHAVRVAALDEPRTELARAARSGWAGPVEDIVHAPQAPVFVDALFGTGQARPLPERSRFNLASLVNSARLSIAVDLPSGVASDDGSCAFPPPVFDITLALGAVKPAHLLQPGARHCGDVRLLPIIPLEKNDMRVLSRPWLDPPGPDSQKYNRGLVAVAGGAMAGAQLLAATAAMRAGAGYVELLGGTGGGPHALVHRDFDDEALSDKRIGALLIGPGLGRDDRARERLDRAMATDHALVIDGDALHLVADRIETLRDRRETTILTPHAGEFDAVFGKDQADKVTRALAAAQRAGAVVVFKGPDTVIAEPGGGATLCPDANDWLSTAGTGDVLAGTIAAMRAGGLEACSAAQAGVWLHARAARRLGAAFIADDVANELSVVRASL